MNPPACRTADTAWRIQQNDGNTPQRNVSEPPVPSGVTVASGLATMAANRLESSVWDDPDNDLFGNFFNALDTKTLKFERSGDQLGNEHGFLSEIVWSVGAT